MVANPSMLLVKADGAVTGQDRAGAVTPAVTGAVRYRPDHLALYDDFNRANGVGLGTSPSGHVANVANANVKIENGRQVPNWAHANAASYPRYTLANTPTRLAARFSFASGAASPNNAVALICSHGGGGDGFPGAPNNMLHFVVAQSAWFINVYENGVAGPNLASGALALAIDGTQYEVALDIAPATSSATVTKPDGSTQVVSDPSIARVVGPIVIFELFQNAAGETSVPRFESIEAGSRAVEVLEATTNLLTNPSAETNLTNINAAVGAVQTRVRDRATSGNFAVQSVTPGAATGEGHYYTTANGLALAGAHTFSGSVDYAGAGLIEAYLILFYTDASFDFSALLPLTAQPYPQRATIAPVTSNAGKTVDHVWLVVDTRSSAQAVTFLTDSAQVEEKAYATPYADGSLGTGYAWTGTAHASTSTRTAATVKLDEVGRIDPQRGAVALWFMREVDTGAVGTLLEVGEGTTGLDQLSLQVAATDVLRLAAKSDGAAVQNTSHGTSLAINVWHLAYFEWGGTATGVSLDGGAIVTGTRDAPEGSLVSANDLAIGSGRTGALQLNGRIERVQVFDQPLAPATVALLATQTAPWVFGQFVALSLGAAEESVHEIGVPGPSGAGVTAAQLAAILADLATALAGLGVVVQEEGSPLTTRGETLNFVGAGVTASGTGAVKTITIPGAGTISIIVQEGDSTVEAAATTLDFNADRFDVTASPSGEANIDLANRSPVLFNKATKSYSSTSVSTTEATVLSMTLGPLLNGIVYDCIVVAIAQAGGGAGFLDVGMKLGTDATVFGMRIGTVGGERPVMASDDAPITGTGASLTCALRAVTTTGTGSVVAAHIFGFAIPRK